MSLSTVANKPYPQVEAASPLLNLPPELHLQISTHLLYPDALALKHTNSHFYAIISTNIKQRVSWLVFRHKRRLQCPGSKCILKTDSAFCNGANGEVRRIMERRRKHQECKSGNGGCEVVLGRSCQGPRVSAVDSLRDQWRWMTSVLGQLGQWTILALVLSVIVNIYLVVHSDGAVLGLLTTGDGYLWSNI